METGDVAALTTEQVTVLTTSQIVALTTDQVAAFTTAGVTVLSTNQISQGLTTHQIGALGTDQIAALKTSQVVTLTTDQIAALTTNQVVALRTDQVESLQTQQVAALTTNGTAALETRDLAVLTTTQVQLGLSTDQIVALTTDQVATLTSNQVTALTTDQYAALTTDQRPHLTYGTPLILDLNGNGVSTASIEQGVQFDIFGIDRAVNTGWVTGGDGLLVMDRNHDGSINGGRELFGEGTTMANGQKAENGYMALAEMDTNGDGSISSADADFADLLVWVDTDSDGISQTSELHTLSSLNITQLDLNAQSSTNWDNGNLIGLTSSYTTSDGEGHGMADVWFATEELVAGGTAEPDPTLTAPWQVNTMVDAMARFQTMRNTPDTANPLDTQSCSQSLTVPTMNLSVTGMVDAIRQFATDGQINPGMSGAVSAHVTDSLTMPDACKPNTAILASR